MAHILVVEDDPDTRMLVQLHLESAEHTVTAAADGGEALRLAAARRPDLILTDLDMPHLDGFGLLEAVRANGAFATVPVIFLTSRDDRDTFRMSMQLGADDFVNKPVNRRVLLGAITARLSRLEALKASVSLENTEQPAGYCLHRKIGEGGMSQVFLAENLETGAQQVVKLVPATHVDGRGEERVQRFLEEFALISRINHPHVARIHSQGFTATHAYIVMEYFPGGDLRKLIAQGMTPALAVNSLLQMLGALGAIHDTGVIHRDMKPDNVMIRADGSLAIADFGIAKNINAVGSLTRHGEIFGTPYYLAPEQAVGEVLDARADLYSTGVMFHEMLTGKRPYSAQSAQALLYQHVHSPVPRLPAGLGRFQPVLDGLMAKHRDHRFSSAASAVDFIAASGLKR